ncbi:MAG: hypothetical protein CTY12_05780 [Methylotenera sp.]|nr:MAG: hypothetical protein CTY12_05780 [Methylotenera sp.]
MGYVACHARYFGYLAGDGWLLDDWARLAQTSQFAAWIDGVPLQTSFYLADPAVLVDGLELKCFLQRRFFGF